MELLVAGNTAVPQQILQPVSENSQAGGVLLFSLSLTGA